MFSLCLDTSNLVIEKMKDKETMRKVTFTKKELSVIYNINK